MKKIITILLCILLAFEITSLGVVTKVRAFMAKDNIIDKIETIDFSKAKLDEDPYFGEYFKEIYAFFEECQLPTSILDNFINSKITKHFIGEVGGNMTEYILENKDRPIISEKYIDDLAQELVDYTFDSLKINPSDLDFDISEFTTVITEELKANISLLPKTSQLSNKINPQTLSLIHFVISDTLTIILTIILIITVVTIILLNVQKASWISKLAIPTICSGIILFIISILVKNILDFIATEPTSALYYLINSLISFLAVQLKNMSIIIIIAATVILLVNIIARNFIIGMKNDNEE